MTKEALMQSKMIMANIGNENIALHNEVRESHRILEEMVAEKVRWVAEKAVMQETGALQRLEIARLKEQLTSAGVFPPTSSVDPATPLIKPRGGRRPSLGALGLPPHPCPMHGKPTPHPPHGITQASHRSDPRSGRAIRVRRPETSTGKPGKRYFCWNKVARDKRVWCSQHPPSSGSTRRLEP